MKHKPTLRARAAKYAENGVLESAALRGYYFDGKSSHFDGYVLDEIRKTTVRAWLAGYRRAKREKGMSR